MYNKFAFKGDTHEIFIADYGRDEKPKSIFSSPRDFQVYLVNGTEINMMKSSVKMLRILLTVAFLPTLITAFSMGSFAKGVLPGIIILITLSIGNYYGIKFDKSVFKSMKECNVSENAPVYMPKPDDIKQTINMVSNN